MTLEVFAPGSTVMLGEIPALVNALTIRGTDDIQYNVVYWTNGIRYDIWVSSYEVSEKKASGRITLGLVNNG